MSCWTSIGGTLPSGDPNIKQAVRRNIERFPEDFMFEITETEYNSLKNRLTSQIVISNERGGRRYMPLPLPNKGWQCFRASYAAEQPYK